MKFKKILLFCFWYFLLTLNSNAFEYGLRYFYKTGLPFGGINQQNYQLQNPPANFKGSQTELMCILSETRIILGIGLDSNTKKYYLVDSETKKHRNFVSNYESYFLKIGYSLAAREKLFYEVGLRASFGNFSFSESGLDSKNMSGKYSLGLDAKFVNIIIDNGIKLNLIGGVGFQKEFIPSFYFSNRNFSSEDFGVGVNMFMGLGISF
jgi:hypothetical protein